MSMTVGDFIVERLHTWGVRRIFGYPGDGINGVFGAMGRAPDKIEFIQARHAERPSWPPPMPSSRRTRRVVTRPARRWVMEDDKHERIRQHAHKLWEDEGRPEGRHEEHWAKAEQHVGMMGDGTEEQNLNQPGDPTARITEAEVQDAFRQEKTS